MFRPSRKRPYLRALPRYGVALLSSLALIAAAGCSSSSSSSSASSSASGSTTGVVKLGAVFNLSGEYSYFEIPALDGLKYAVSQINQTGFVVAGKKYKLDLIVAPDAAGSSANVVLDTRTLIANDHVNFMYGPVSAGTSAALPITNASNVILLTASTTIYQDLGPQNPLLFRVSVDDTWRGQLDETWIKTVDPGVKTSAFLEINDSEGDEVLATEAAEFAAAGITPVAKLLYPPGTTDFTPYLTKIAALHPGIFLPSVASPDNLVQLRQAIQLNLAPAYEAGLTPAQLTSDIPSSFTGKILAIQTGPQFDIPTTPAAKAFITGLQAFLGGTLPVNDQYSTYYYDSTFMLVKAMEMTGSTTNTSLIAKAFSTMTYHGLYGAISYHGGHKVDYPVDNCIYQGGVYSCQNQTLSPSGTLEILGSSSEKLK
jgi:branched-chain amino acid transport system substrate-binding protein